MKLIITTNDETTVYDDCVEVTLDVDLRILHYVLSDEFIDTIKLSEHTIISIQDVSRK